MDILMFDEFGEDNTLNKTLFALPALLWGTYLLKWKEVFFMIIFTYGWLHLNAQAEYNFLTFVAYCVSHMGPSLSPSKLSATYIVLILINNMS